MESTFPLACRLCNIGVDVDLLDQPAVVVIRNLPGDTLFGPGQVPRGAAVGDLLDKIIAEEVHRACGPPRGGALVFGERVLARDDFVEGGTFDDPLELLLIWDVQDDFGQFKDFGPRVLNKLIKAGLFVDAPPGFYGPVFCKAQGDLCNERAYSYYDIMLTPDGRALKRNYHWCDSNFGDLDDRRLMIIGEGTWQAGLGSPGEVKIKWSAGAAFASRVQHWAPDCGLAADVWEQGSFRHEYSEWTPQLVHPYVAVMNLCDEADDRHQRGSWHEFISGYRSSWLQTGHLANLSEETLVAMGFQLDTLNYFAWCEKAVVVPKSKMWRRSKKCGYLDPLFQEIQEKRHLTLLRCAFDTLCNVLEHGRLDRDAHRRLGTMIDVDDMKDGRGWAMRGGNCKRLRGEKGRESIRGRAAFARSVNKCKRFDHIDMFSGDVKTYQRQAAMQLRADLRDQLAWHVTSQVTEPLLTCTC